MSTCCRRYRPAGVAVAVILAVQAARIAVAAAQTPAAAPIDETPESNQPPVAVFSAYPPEGPAPLIVNLDGSASADLDGSIASYAWDLGDGGPAAAGPVVDHAYAASGTYPVTLTVTDNEGGVHRQLQTVVVASAASPEPSPLIQRQAASRAPEERVDPPRDSAADDPPRDTSLVVSVADPSGRPLAGADLVIQWPQGVQTAHAEYGVAMFATGDQTLPPDWLGRAVTVTARAEAHQPQSRQIVIVAGLDNPLTLTLRPQAEPTAP